MLASVFDFVLGHWLAVLGLVFAAWFYRRYLHSDYTAPRAPHASVPPVRTFTGRDLPVNNPCTGERITLGKLSQRRKEKLVTPLSWSA